MPLRFRGPEAEIELDQDSSAHEYNCNNDLSDGELSVDDNGNTLREVGDGSEDEGTVRPDLPSLFFQRKRHRVQ